MMNDYPIYYVYEHVDPDTGEIVYIGHGKFERAWRCSTTNNPTHYGHRSVAHAEWLFEMAMHGFTPDSWVNIIQSGLTKKEAARIELSMIHSERPKFNRSIRRDKKLDGSRAQEYRDAGMYYSEIANKLDVSAMTVWRYLNG